jgi:hypothetical protein
MLNLIIFQLKKDKKRDLSGFFVTKDLRTGPYSLWYSNLADVDKQVGPTEGADIALVGFLFHLSPSSWSSFSILSSYSPTLFCNGDDYYISKLRKQVSYYEVQSPKQGSLFVRGA